MRTRKRLRETEEQIKAKTPVVTFDEDFIEEDYQKVQKLLKEAAKASKNHKKKGAASEDRFSTEADIEAPQVNACNRSQYPDELPYPTRKLSDDSDPVSNDSSSEQNVSEEKRIGKKRSTKKNSFPETTAKSSKARNSKRRRDAKELQKLKVGFSDFLSLVRQMNSPDLPKLVLEGLGVHVADSEDELPQNQTLLEVNKPQNSESSFTKVRKSFRTVQSDVRDDETGTSNIQRRSVVGSQLVVRQNATNNFTNPSAHHDPSVNYYSLQEDTTESVSLVQNQQPQAARASAMGGYPLEANSSLHVRCAYFILIKKKEAYYQEQYRLMMQREEEIRQKRKETLAQLQDLGSTISGKNS